MLCHPWNLHFKTLKVIQSAIYLHGYFQKVVTDLDAILNMGSQLQNYGITI